MNLKIDIKELTKLTKKAISDGARSLSEKDLKRSRLSAIKTKRYQRTAQSILDLLPGKMERAAMTGKNAVKVMKLKQSRDLPEDWYNRQSEITNGNIFGVAKMVYDTCKEAHLNPNIRHCHDGAGMYSWYELWVEWPKR